MQNDNCQMDNILHSKFEASEISVFGQEPSAVPPTHESCDDSDEDEWKYVKDGQGEKQLGLQGDIVVEEELQKQLPEAGALSSVITEQVSTADSDNIKSIAATCDSFTQQLTAVAESAVNTIGDTLEHLNISQSSTQEKLDNLEDEDLSASEMNSKLNPEAKEFVPTFSPPGSAETVEIANGFAGAPPTAIPPHFKDELLAYSPRKGRETNMENINIPAENEFEQEIAHKPHGLPGDEAIIDHAENGELFQEMNWKEAMHGSEKEEGPLVDSPVTEESLEVVDNVQAFDTTQLLSEFSAPVDLDNAGMKQSIYIENNTSVQSNEEDVLNTVQMLPVEDNESKDSSFEVVSEKNEIISAVAESVPEKDAVTKDDVQEILTLASEEKKEDEDEKEIEHKMEQLLLSHDHEITKDVQLETEQVKVNGVEISPTTPEAPEVALTLTNLVEPIVEQAHEQSAPVELSSSPVPVADEALEGLTIGAAVAVAVAATTAAVKKVEAEKNQKNLSKTSSATKSKVPDTKKPAVGTTTKTSTASSVAAKRTLGDKPKPTTGSTLATKKTVGSTTSAAPRPRTAPAAGAVKTPTEKKTTTTTTTSTAKSRIDTKPPLTARRPLVSSAAKTTTSKSTDDAKSSSTTVRSTISSKSAVGSKTSIGSTRTTPSTNSISKPRPATASSVATTNGSATKTAASKPTTLAHKSAVPPKASLTSPRGTLTSTLRKTEAIKSPTKTTSSTLTSRVSTTNGTKTTTSTRTTTTKTTLSTVPSAAARSTTTTSATTRRSVTGTPSTIGATTPTSKTSNLVPRKSTPLKKTSSTPPVRKSLGSKLNASATKPTKDTTTPRPVTIPAQHQHNNSIVAAEEPKVLPPLESPPADNEQPKLNGIASLDDVPSPTIPVASHPFEMEIA